MFVWTDLTLTQRLAKNPKLNYMSQPFASNCALVIGRQQGVGLEYINRWCVCAGPHVDFIDQQQPVKPSDRQQQQQGTSSIKMGSPRAINAAVVFINEDMLVCICVDKTSTSMTQAGCQLISSCIVLFTSPWCVPMSQHECDRAVHEQSL